jgi:hypothetical protein
MNQKTTAFCVAAAFGCIATLGAQTPTSTTSSQSNTMRSTPAHDVTLTGCLAKGADGRFVLNNAKMDDQMSSTTTAGTTTAGTSAGTPASKTNMPAAATWVLGGGTDLDKHLGHKIQVTGKTAWDGSTAPGATAGSTSTTGTTAGTTGSTTTGEQRTTSESDSKAANQPRLDVQSVKMIAATCS